MAKISSILRSVKTSNGDGIAYFCPGCKKMHIITISGKYAWQFNGDVEKPTINPSILVTGVVELTEDEYTQVMNGIKIKPIPLICHSFIRDGIIDFLPDCTHNLAGQKIPIPSLGINFEVD